MKHRQHSRPAKILRGLALAAFVANLSAAEPWADQKMPVNDGLALWLDAAKIRDVLPAIGIKFFDLTKRRVEAWPDASGNGRHARQANVEFRPVLQTSMGGSAVRFDGRDDFLSAAWSAKLDATSVFIVAAPRLNGGGFRALASLHPPDRNDFIAGLNVDLGAAAGTTLDRLNIEGAGARGQSNLLRTRFDLGTFHVFTIAAAAEKISLRVDGKDESSRARKAEPIELSEFIVGARWYSNDASPRSPRGFFDGDIAEVIVFDRALTTDERAKVEKYLLEKHSVLRTQRIVADAPPGAKPLRAVEHPAPVQCLMPGFEAREVPLKLTNINFIKYRHDGALFAGAYNGKIWLLRDTDGDGIEDHAELFYESPNIKSVMGLAVAPKGYPRGDGVFIACVGHVFFIPEKDGKGEKEITVAEGWPPPQIVTGGVSDCLGVALDHEGGVWFGLGTSDFTRPYLPDPNTGAMTYRLPTERGTIQHVSPDFRTRETVCTGIRFPVGLAFNSRGDLFCTDQEGATWLPNGNPLDELLHIQRGRHYGFPPRHPKFLPGVVDEPSVFDFSPQHQSTCGFFFNEADSPAFGPTWWRGDAFVCGESRGKLWRVSLAKTDAGYIAQSQLFAHLNMLPIDATLSPRGDLVVTCHSGSPDWGSGPNGIGKIFHIRHARPALPKPVLAWPASATESVVTWDRPLTEAQFAEIKSTMEITSGPYVRAGDRYESLRPGYQVVSDQLAVPRLDVPVKNASLSPDHRSIILQTPPRQAGVHYAIQLGGFMPEKPWTPPNLPPPPPPKKSDTLPQQNSVDLDLTLNGVEATLEPANLNADTKPILAIILTGNDGPFHDWLKTSAALRSELERDRRFQVRIVTDPEFLASDELFSADVLVQHYVNWMRPGLSEKAKANLLRFVAEGRGLCVAHFANGAFIDTLPGAKGSDWPEYRGALLRRWWDFAKGSTHDDYGPFRAVPASATHPITAGLAPFDTTDELYCKQVGDAPMEPLITARCVKTGRDEPLAIAFEHGKGRVFQCMLGHSDVSMHCAGELWRRGIAWAAGRAPTIAREWKGWLPHPDPSVARELTRASSEHVNFFSALQQPGKLTLRGQFDFYEMLQPAIQPGSKLDYERPTENVTVRIESSALFTLANSEAKREGEHFVAQIAFNAPKQQWQPFELKIEKPAGGLALTMTWSTSDDPRPRAFPLRRFFVPWATREAQTIIAEEERRIPEIAGGNWLRGKNLFFSKATCFVCHAMNSAGGKVGPDLSNLCFRDYASVLRDIREPSAAINPDFAAYVVQTNDGATITAVLNGERDGALRFTDVAGQIHSIARANLKTMQALPISLMPEKLLDVLTTEEQRDLLTFLLQPPFDPAPIEHADPPMPRKRSEIDALLKNIAAPSAEELKPMSIVLCAGPKDHGAGEHDYPLWQKRWSRLLAMADGVTVSTAWNWPSDEQWKKADLIVFFSDNPSWNAQTAPQLEAFLARGGGAAFFHYAVDGHKDVESLASQIGLAWRGGFSKFRHGALELDLKPHPLTQGLPKLSLFDESYWNLVGDESRIQLIASGNEENSPRPLMWTREQGKGRVFVSIPGHFTWTFDDPLFRILIFRGMMWSARQPIDRLAPLVTVGAHIK